MMGIDMSTSDTTKFKTTPSALRSRIEHLTKDIITLSKERDLIIKTLQNICSHTDTVSTMSILNNRGTIRLCKLCGSQESGVYLPGSSKIPDGKCLRDFEFNREYESIRKELYGQ
jgi:hypothetical protein